MPSRARAFPTEPEMFLPPDLFAAPNHTDGRRIAAVAPCAERTGNGSALSSPA